MPHPAAARHGRAMTRPRRAPRRVAARVALALGLPSLALPAAPLPGALMSAPLMSAPLLTAGAATLVSAALTPQIAPAAPLGGDARRDPIRIEELPPFREAALRDALRMVVDAMGKGRLADAAVLSRNAARLEPALPELWALEARLMAAAGGDDQALRALRAAVELGFWDEAALDRPEFNRLRERPGFAALRETAEANEPPAPLPARPEPTPAPIGPDGTALIAEANTAWDAGADALRSHFAPRDPAAAPDRAVDPDHPGGALLNRLVAAGEAAGNLGDFYDNRDGGHSILDPDFLPGMAILRYGPEAKRARLERGIAHAHLYGGPTIGNSSTAVTKGPRWRSMARQALTEPGGGLELYRQYRRNQLYVYPEHKDHDPFFGDVFPAQTPYMFVTQGSSWSDKPMLRALGMALAALRPDVKAKLEESGLIAPTLQMLVRRSMKGIETDADYLSPAAHPAVFEAREIEFERLVARANALALDEIPPPATLRLLAETRPDSRTEVFGDGLDERLFDTPHAIARIARGAYATRVFRLTAASTADPNGRPLRFHWQALTGGAKGVKIEKLSEDGAEVRIEIPWQDDLRAVGRPDLVTSRLDVMAVADNGAQLGAPAFLSVQFPARRIAEFDGERPRSMHYDARSRLDRYQDPVLFPKRRWSDDYRYDDQGGLLGWTRTHHDGRVERFSRHGALVEKTDDQGRPLVARMMSYPRGPDREREGEQINEAPLDAALRYEYEGPDDLIGVAEKTLPEG